MRNKEVELIAALAEGKLEDETEARALVTSSTKHQAEYDAQKTAYEALSSIPSAQLTEHESAALHRDIWTEFQAQPEAETTKAPWFYRWSYAVAGLFVVVGLVIVIDQTNSDFAPTSLLSSGDDSASEAPVVTSSADEAEDFSAESAATDTSESVTDAGADQESDGVAEYADPDVAGLTKVAEQTRSGQLQSFDLAATNFDAAMVDDMTQCIESAGLADHEVVGDVEVENHYIVAVPAGVELGPDTPVSFVDIKACQVAYTHE